MKNFDYTGEILTSEEYRQKKQELMLHHFDAFVIQTEWHDEEFPSCPVCGSEMFGQTWCKWMVDHWVYRYFIVCSNCETAYKVEKKV